MPMLGGQSTQQWEIQGPLVVLAQPLTGYGHIGSFLKTWEVPEGLEATERRSSKLGSGSYLVSMA